MPLIINDLDVGRSLFPEFRTPKAQKAFTVAQALMANFAGTKRESFAMLDEFSRVNFRLIYKSDLRVEDRINCGNSKNPVMEIECDDHRHEIEIFDPTGAILRVFAGRITCALNRAELDNPQDTPAG